VAPESRQGNRDTSIVDRLRNELAKRLVSEPERPEPRVMARIQILSTGSENGRSRRLERR
jgi:hypothetical protein